MLQDLLIEKCDKLKRHAVKMADSFYPPEYMYDSVIGPSDGQFYERLMERLLENEKIPL